MELLKLNDALKVIQRPKATTEDLLKMQDTIERLMHSKLDLILFCNAYESEEIVYEKKNLIKAVQKGKILQSNADLLIYDIEHDEEYEKLKREVMQILSKRLFIKCLQLTDDALDP